MCCKIIVQAQGIDSLGVLVEAREEPCVDLELNLLNKESSKCKRACDKRELGVYQEDRGLEFRK